MYALPVISSCISYKCVYLVTTLSRLFLSIIISTSQDITLARRIVDRNGDLRTAASIQPRHRLSYSVHLFFAANQIPDKKTVAVFLRTIGGKTYELLRVPEPPRVPQAIRAYGHFEATLLAETARNCGAFSFSPPISDGR